MKKNIVILGGGFGGIKATLTLLKKFKEQEFENYNIILIEKNKYHTFTPLLYEVASFLEDDIKNKNLQEIVALDLSLIFKRFLKRNKLKIINDEVIGLDIQNKKIIFPRNNFISYEYLILALGTEAKYLNLNKELGPFLTLKNLTDAFLIRENLLKIIKKAEKNNYIPEIIIVGGGPTGIELASEIKNQLKNKINLTLIDASKRILDNLEEKTSKAAEKRLKKLKIETITNEYLKGIEDNFVVLESKKKIRKDLLILSLGVKPNKLIDNLPFPKNKQGRLKVNEYLNFDSVFAIGDIAVIEDKSGKVETPYFARFAIKEGKVAALNVLKIIRGKKNFIKFKPKKYPYIIPLGGKYALAKIGPFLLKGIIAWIFKGVVELNYFLDILPFTKAIKIWLKGFILFAKNKKLG